MPALAAQIEAQLKREHTHSAEATAEYLRNLQDALAKGQIDNIPAAGRVIARLFTDVRDQLQVLVDTTARGPGAALRGWLRKIPVDTLAVLSMRTVLTSALRDNTETPATVQRIAHTLGRAIEQEALVQDAYRVNPVYVDRTWEYLHNAGTSSPGHIRKTMRAVVQNVLDGKFDGYLTNAEYIHLGKHGLDACLNAGLVEIVRGGLGDHTNVVYRVPEALYEVLAYIPQTGLSGAAHMMLAPPEPWTGAAGGGYYSDRMQVDFPLRRVNRRTRPHLRHTIRDNVAQAAPVLQCANYLQAQAFTVHRPTMDLVRRVWDQGGGVLGIPHRESPPQPEFPLREPWDKATAPPEEVEIFHAWKRKVHQWHTAKKDLRKAQQSIAQALRATVMRNEGPVWFPSFIDSRGRYYYRGLLNPQGSDIAKAVLHFHERRPLGTSGEYWLKVHIANCFGQDKARFKARAAWVDLHWEALCAGLDAPEDCDLYRDNHDAPIAAVAACWELREAKRYAAQHGSSAGYCTGIPVHMDATCSGLQHFSALLRDPVGGHYVNLLDSGGEFKADIYRKVAEMAKARVLRDAANPAHKAQHIAALWADYDIPRDLSKKPVMTYVYGATLRGVAEFVAEYMDETQMELPEGVRVFEVAYYMAKTLFAAIEDTVPAAAACMRWLRQRASQADKNAPMLWCTPTGLLVEHDYRDYTEHRVALRSCGVTKIVVREELESTRGQRMQNAIAPNFVHALDAAHLTFTANALEAEGVAMVAIHDSFGCHPGDVQVMHKCIREAFVRLYKDFDPLAMLQQGIGQEATPPMQGNLDISEFRDSEFGFC